MNNQDYVKTLGIADKETLHKVLNAMEQYGDNHWWERDADSRQMAYYQLRQDLLLVDFSRFHKAIESLLGRPVWRHEFGVNRKSLLFESERALGGQVATEAEKGQAIATGMNALADTLEKRDQR